MIVLHSVEIRNIRSIGTADFHPLTDGSTALNGVNGAGKSSVVASLMFALYGVTPDGVSIKAMRRQESDGECRATAVFTHDNQTVEIERGLKGLKDTTYARITVDGVEITSVSPKTATNWITARFGGLDAIGFLTAFVVLQKELDGLVRARPAERKKLIERLAGIDRMSTALDAARKEEKVVKDRLALLPGSGDEVDAAAAALEAAQQEAITAWEAFEAARDAAVGTATAFRTAEAAQAQMLDQLQRYDLAADAARALQSIAHVAQERLEGAEREQGRLMLAAVGGTPQDVESALAEERDAEVAATANRDSVSAAARAQADAERDLADAVKAEQAASRLTVAADLLTQQAEKATTAIPEKPMQDPAGLLAQITSHSAVMQKCDEDRGALRGDFERLEKAITALTGSTDPECPTCLTALGDPAALIATLTTAREDVRGRGKALVEQSAAANTAVETARTEHTALLDAFTQADRLTEAAAGLSERATLAHAEANTATSEAAPLRTTATASAERARSAADDATSALAAADTVAARLTAAKTALRAAETAADARNALPAAQTAVDAAEISLEADTAKFKEAAGIARTLKVTDEDRTRITGAFTLTQTAAQAGATESERLEGAFKLAEAHSMSAERAHEGELAKLRARAQTLALLEQKSAVTDSLNAFRTDRIARLAPELSEVATDFVSRMTEGKFVSVELDVDFTPVITDNKGQQRPVAWLSGGEESAVALALRVAIGELIAGQSGGVLFLDEVLSAQDGTRRPAMMSAIRDLPGRQIIMINHVTEASDMVDLVLDVIPDDVNGSTIVAGGAESAILVTDDDLDDMDEAV